MDRSGRIHLGGPGDFRAFAHPDRLATSSVNEPRNPELKDPDQSHQRHLEPGTRPLRITVELVQRDVAVVDVVNEARYHCANRPLSDAHHISPTRVEAHPWARPSTDLVSHPPVLVSSHSTTRTHSTKRGCSVRTSPTGMSLRRGERAHGLMGEHAVGAICRVVVTGIGLARLSRTPSRRGAARPGEITFDAPGVEATGMC